MGVREPHCSISGAVGGFAPDIHGAQGGVREPHCSILGAVGGSAPDINGAQGGCFSQRHGANTMKCAVSLTFIGLSMSVQLIEWAHMGLERQSVDKSGHEPR